MIKERFFRVYFFDFDDLKYYPVRYTFGTYSRVRDYFNFLLHAYPDGRFIMQPV